MSETVNSNSVGVGSLDFDFHQLDSDLYDEVVDRANQVYEDAKAKYIMIPEPLPSKEILEANLDAVIERKQKYLNHRIPAPKIIIENEDHRILELENLLSTGQYLSTDEDYENKKNYDIKYHEWLNSSERYQIFTDIENYNERAYYMCKYPKSSENEFLEWQKTLIREIE